MPDTGGAGQAQLRQDRPHHPLHQPQRPAARLAPGRSGLPPGGANGIATLTTVESTAKSRYRGITVGLDKRMSGNYAYQVYYTWSKDESDDDNERDPFTFRYADITQLDREFSYSDRDQRHRVNAWALFRLPAELDLNLRYAYRSAQPKSITADRHRRRARRRTASTPTARVDAPQPRPQGQRVQLASTSGCRATSPSATSRCSRSSRSSTSSTRRTSCARRSPSSPSTSTARCAAAPATRGSCRWG